MNEIAKVGTAPSGYPDRNRARDMWQAARSRLLNDDADLAQ